MSTNSVAPLRKFLNPSERSFLKQANRVLLEQQNGRIASAAFMDLVADWHGYSGPLGFEGYAKGWVTDGNAKNTHADRLLRELFGLDGGPEPKRAA